MTVSRTQSFNIHSSCQFKLKSNRKHNSSAFIECHTIHPSVDSTETGVKATNKNMLYNVHAAQIQEHAICKPNNQFNSNEFGSVKNSAVSLSRENNIQSDGLISIAPCVEANKRNIHLTITPIQITSRRINVTRHKLRRNGKILFWRSWLNRYRSEKNPAFYSPPLEHPVKQMRIDLTPSNGLPNGNQTFVTTSVDPTPSCDDGEISNSSLNNVDRDALKDELAAYMDEIHAREKR